MAGFISNFRFGNLTYSKNYQIGISFVLFMFWLIFCLPKDAPIVALSLVHYEKRHKQ